MSSRLATLHTKRAQLETKAVCCRCLANHSKKSNTPLGFNDVKTLLHPVWLVQYPPTTDGVLDIKNLFTCYPSPKPYCPGGGFQVPHGDSKTCATQFVKNIGVFDSPRVRFRSILGSSSGTSPASPASSASAPAKDADDASDAGDVADAGEGNEGGKGGKDLNSERGKDLRGEREKI